MTVALDETVLDQLLADLDRDRTDAAPAPGRVRTRRRGPGVGPVARPRRLRFAAAPAARSRACQGGAVPQDVVRPRPRSWRLTDRGAALVMVLAATLVVASVVVVGLTAFRVTGEGYRSGPATSAGVLTRP